MRRIGFLLVGALVASTALFGDEPPSEPIELGTTEQAEVRLVLIDAVVVDSDGRTVPDLARDDFEVLSFGRPFDIDTLDVACSAGAMDDPDSVRRAKKREAVPATDHTRRIVLAFDYLHLGAVQREESFDHAIGMVEHGASVGDEVMIVALTGGIRIEQPFTDDRVALLGALRRMRFDISLWNGNFAHVNEFGFVRGLTGLFDTLEPVPGRKSVVLYSGMTDVPLDLQFQEIAATATTARCAVYPVDARGLGAPDVGFDRAADPAPG